MIMTFLNSELRLEIAENQINLITIEAAKEFEEICGDVIEYVNKSEERILFYDQEKPINPLSEIDLIVSPFSLEINKRTSQKPLIKTIIEEEEQNEGLELLQDAIAKIHQGLEKIGYLSEYNLEYKEIENTSDLLKLIDVHVEIQDEKRFIERILPYIAAITALQNKKTIILLNCGGVLDEKEYEELQKWCGYLCVTMIFIDYHREQLKNNYNGYIIDKDMCILH